VLSFRTIAIGVFSPFSWLSTFLQQRARMDFQVEFWQQAAPIRAELFSVERLEPWSAAWQSATVIADKRHYSSYASIASQP
jgi:hypothetical protein